MRNRVIAIFVVLIVVANPVFAQNLYNPSTNPQDPLQSALSNLARQYQAYTISGVNLGQALDTYQHAVDDKIKSLEARVKELEEQVSKK